MNRSPLKILGCVLAAGVVCGCDNVARVFDKKGKSGSGSAGDATFVQAVRAGGKVMKGRPRVEAVFPTGSGWPATVPIVVVFSESMNEDSIVPPQGTAGSPRVFVRAKGSQQALPASYDFLLGGTVVVVRPAAPLPTRGAGQGGQQGPAISYEVAVDPEVRDVDGLRLGGSEPKVVAEFTPDEDPQRADGRVLVTLPVDRARDVPRETPIYAVFTKPATTSTVTTSTFRVEDANGKAVNGRITFPLGMTPGVGAGDGRVARFDPTTVLDGAVEYRLVFTKGIAFAGGGELDFGRRTPFSRFTTLAFEAPTSVAVGNALAGFPDKVNRSNHDTLRIDVGVAASVAAGDTVVVRLYGGEPRTKAKGDLAFVEREVRVASGGVQTVAVDFTGALGSLSSPRLEEGPLTLAAHVARGSRRTGFVLASSGSSASLDLTPPTLQAIGAAGAAGNIVFTDQEHVTLYGVASERLGKATLTAGTASAELHAGAEDGRFLMAPLFLGRRTSALSYQLTITDAAGNVGASVIGGSILQRGVVTGSVAGETLVVEAFDESTLAAVQGAQVLVEPGLPVKPPAGRLTASTDAQGRAVFQGLGQPRYTITLVAAGYHLTTLLDTGAGFVSLPLRPLTKATAKLRGSVVFTPAGGATALVGSNLIDDPGVEAIRTQGSTPTVIPETEVLPSRPQALTAFTGVFEPTGVPTFTTFSCQLCGADGGSRTPPPAPGKGGETTNITLTQLPAGVTAISLAGTYEKDFAASAGLDVGNLTGTPTVRIVGSLQGFPGMTLFGVGFATKGSGARYTIQGTYSLSTVLALEAFSPVLWVSTEARDTAGNLARHRRLISNNGLGTTFATVATPGIPTPTVPATSTDAPAVTYADRLDRSKLLGGHAIREIVVEDPTGRRWSVLREDLDDDQGSETVQLPAGIGTAGLAKGKWKIRVEDTLLFSQTFASGGGDYVLAERRRQQVTFARSATVETTVN